LENNLAASGIKADDVDAIILTHGHIDHLSGIMTHPRRRVTEMTGHIRQRGENSWELKFDTSRDEKTGKTHYAISHLQGHQEGGQA
jgi:glyoxylase-like metal-dependent hydrolase (beta-lactamase superfamily II)